MVDCGTTRNDDEFQSKNIVEDSVVVDLSYKRLTKIPNIQWAEEKSNENDENSCRNSEISTNENKNQNLLQKTFKKAWKKLKSSKKDSNSSSISKNNQKDFENEDLLRNLNQVRADQVIELNLQNNFLRTIDFVFLNSQKILIEIILIFLVKRK